MTLVVDGKAGVITNEIRSAPFFSDDSKRFGYFELQTVLVVDGKYFEQGGFEVRKAVFAPKSGKLMALMNGRVPDGPVKDFVVLFGNQRGPVLDEVVPPNPDLFEPAFSADGNHVAYAGKRAEGYVVVRDDKEGPVVSDLLGPVVENVITRRLCFAADGSVEYLAVKDGSLYRIVQR